MKGNWKAANAVEGKCGFTRSMMTFNIFALNTCDLNIDMFEIFQVSSENLREIFMKNKFISDDCLTAVFGGSGGSTAVPYCTPLKQLPCQISEM